MASSEIDRLVQLMAKLPGLGPRSARRAVLHLLNRREALMQPLTAALDSVATQVRACSVCGNLDTVDPCPICADATRDRSLVCVVQDVADLWAIERTASYRGLYHVLGGVLSALDGIRPEDLNIAPLVARVAAGDLREIILAMNATVEGQSTAHYLTDRLAAVASGLTVSRLAHGVPVGGELDYLDEGTLTAALRSRRKLQ